MSPISTSILSPTLRTSSTRSTRLPSPTFEMCSSPSRPGTSEMNAPKSVVLTTVPRKRSPTFGRVGFAIELIISTAASACEPFSAAT